MNKLILVGNGFDLAHGLPTSYKHFIDDIWKNLANNHSDPELSKIFELGDDLVRFLLKKNIENFNDFDTLMNTSVSRDISYKRDTLFAENKFLRRVLLKVKNDFFILINSKNYIENWVDIENEYYLQLKKIVNLPKLQITKSEEDHLIEKKEKVEKLNKEFEEVKNLLIKYLKEKVLLKFNIEKITTKEAFLEMYKIFKPNSSLNDNKWDTREFSTFSDSEHISKIYKDEKVNNKIHCYSYIVNFNYTDSSHLYFLETYDGTMENGNINSIHGEIDSENFKPVFGFGDEMDEDYQLIENIDDNKYLEFFKSFQYFQNNNYDQLLSTIDSEKFQVIILGHSCGLSDRVMLNTIFEHKNCRSIKIYYHQKEDGSDNYLDIVKNISRHFKDKPSMRRKIVSKEYSSPLPQNVRFKKIEKKQ
ncbi:AbiH family protein [Polaribacter staleyi]|uniref:AbiH family protein n=1 Tax=Polaribacter staleyi TaxID=2022337 RepID=UPI0031BB091E